MISFSAARLAREPIELDGEEPPEFLELENGADLEIIAPVSYHLTATLVSGEALVCGSCRTRIRGACGRCLDPVELDVSTGELKLLFEITGAGEEIDVSEDVREEMLLALPMNLLCSDDCPGLCPVCGANLKKKRCKCKAPVDPLGTWSALDDLKLDQ